MAVWIEDLIVKNQYSRPGMKLIGVKGLVIHWTATPGASDENEVKFFDGADGGGGRYASAHLFVDRDSARLDIPLDEVAYHANDHACRIPKLAATASYYKNGGANLTAIGIEMCVEKDGTIHAETITRTVQVAAALCKQFGLNPVADIYRHYDITGKNCPAPWVAKPAEFTTFKNRVAAEVQTGKTVAPVAPVQTGGGIIGQVRVTADGLNIRTGPGTSYPSKGKAITNRVYNVTANVNDWHEIIVRDGEKGWVFGNNGKYLSLVR